MKLKTGHMFSGFIRDVSERHALDRAKKDFVSTVSHELRTPLTSIRGSLGLIEGGVAGELPQKAAELVSIARSNTDRLVRLINDILDLEKIEAGKLALIRTQLTASDLVDTTKTVLFALADERGIQLRSDVHKTLVFWGDRDRLVQVLTNLVSNAIKFSPESADVHLRASRIADCVRFEVEDHAAGIALADQQKLFGKFQQLGNSGHREKGGTGLGLAISKAIVEEHGGVIGVESELGQGSVFFFELPAGNPEQIETPAEPD